MTILQEMLKLIEDSRVQEPKRMSENEKAELFATMPKPQGFPKKAEGPWLEFVEI